MTTYITFAPSAANTPAPFQFQASLDGNLYNIQVKWNLYGQRWYIYVYDLSNNLIVSCALVGSPNAVSIQNLSWSNGFATVTTAVPHGYLYGATANLNFAGNTPSVYNGYFSAYINGRNTLAFVVAQDPGAATVFGTVSADINLVAGYFTTSKLVYREANNQFEVSP